jgi:hypothetical protein
MSYLPYAAMQGAVIKRAAFNNGVTRIVATTTPDRAQSTARNLNGLLCVSVFEHAGFVMSDATLDNALNSVGA